MNDALGKLTPRYQAVLHGSWASTLALVDSSVDITVIERSLPPGRAGYPHTKYKDLDEETQTYIMDPLKQVWCHDRNTMSVIRYLLNTALK